jgi:type IV pilus assembly protein PilC
MPEFRYTARTADGQSRIGTLFSAGPVQVASDLRGRGWIVLDVQAALDAGGDATDLAALLSPFNRLPATRFDVEIGMQQLATMIRSGLSLLTSIKTAGEQVRRPAMKRIWDRIYGEIEGGSSFSDAIAAERRHFPPMVVQLVHVGESSGTLETVLGQAAEHLERARSLRTTLLTALMYPMLVLLLAIGVTAYMVFVVLPILKKFIVHQGHRLPPLTQHLIDITDWLNIHATHILLTTLIVIISVAVMRRIRSTRLWMDRGLLKVPVIGGVLRLAGTALMSRGMALLLGNGINLLDAIQITQGLLANRAMRNRLEMTRQAVIEGQPLAESLLAGREFLPMLGRMAAVGEATGTLDVVLAEVARFHEAQLAGTVKRLSLMIEPVITIVVGGIVGFVYISFFLALFSAGGVR